MNPFEFKHTIGQRSQENASSTQQVPFSPCPVSWLISGGMGSVHAKQGSGYLTYYPKRAEEKVRNSSQMKVVSSVRSSPLWGPVPGSEPNTVPGTLPTARWFLLSNSSWAASVLRDGLPSRCVSIQCRPQTPESLSAVFSAYVSEFFLLPVQLEYQYLESHCFIGFCAVEKCLIQPRYL